MEIKGFNEILEMLDDMEIGDAKVKKALNVGGDEFKKAMENSIAFKTGKAKRSIKKSISRIDGELVCKITIRKWYYTFDEWGTSKNKKNVGKVEKSVSNVTEKVFQLVKNEVLR